MRIFLLVTAVLAAQAQTAETPSFEVASVKLTQHGRGPDGWSHSSLDLPSPGNLTATNESLQGLIQFAYKVQEYEIAGPDWLNSDAASYDILAKAPGATHDQMRAMMQTLLAERFKLAVHKEARTLSGYDLVVLKNGPRQLQASPDGTRGGTRSIGGQVTATHVSMGEFAHNLSRWLHEPVFDKTVVAGNFDFKLDYEPDLSQETDTKPSIFTALQQQLGLKLEPAKVPVEMIVVDRAERVPAEN
ncbi:MAG TPA: TIGR03435 family protein [Bryobacteraceae bacterium]|nr:TIGR03435 family protein [Bryobacteraceae bacterium]